MGLKRAMRNLIIGENHFIEYYEEYQQVILCGRFALIGILACSILGAIELVQGSYAAVLVLGLSNLCLAACVVLHRAGKHDLAHYFLLVPVNITAYLLASSEDAGTGAFVHFISLALVAFIVFGYYHRKSALLFAVFTFILLILAYFTDFSVLPFRHYDEKTILYMRFTNFAIASLVCIAGVFMLIRLNHKNSVKLVENYKLLTKVNTELDRFVYSTSHDLRAPLTSILGLINIADMSNEMNDTKRYLGMMRDRVHLLDKFIKDITDYSRNNRVDIEHKKVNLAKVAQEVWDLLRHTPEAQHVAFQLEIPENVEVESDENRLKTVLLNLISNAIRYQDKKKFNQYVKLCYQLNGKGYNIKVEDNGQGIDPVYHNKIFDMFFRANETSKGSGLGLYIVKETITKLSGTIQLESAPGIGSTFTVKLPYLN